VAQPDGDFFESSGLSQAVGSHQTISRVVRILEEAVYRPGSTYAEITRAVGAPKSSVYGFIRGLLSVDWLIDQDHRLYLGPAFYSLAIASGHVRAGMVAPGDLDTLHRETGLTAFVGVLAGEHLIYIAEAGSDLMASFEARSNIRRRPLATAGGKALLAFMPETELEAYLRRIPAASTQEISDFLQSCQTIRETGVAVNVSPERARAAVATVIRNAKGQGIASLTLVGPSTQVLPRVEALSALLRERVREWQARSIAAPREPI
jgi:DNA-binding IclR family transcriptional regulator